MEKYIVLVLSYVFGSIPFSLIIMRIKGINLRKVGSGNIGATNIARIGNKKLVALALFLDSFKGFISVFIAQQFFSSCSFYIFASTLLTVLGHMFPMWLKFRGGKGVATTFGTLIALSVHMVLLFIFVWTAVFFISRYSSLASLMTVAVIAFISFFFQKDLFLTLLTLTVLVFLKHSKNIGDLIRGKELRFYKQ